MFNELQKQIDELKSEINQLKEDVESLKTKNTKKTKFQKPNVEEVRAYCQERRNGIDAEAFIAFYESKGWLIGKVPMKSWKSAIITWEKSKQNQKSVKQDYLHHNYTKEECMSLIDNLDEVEV